jgi:hypothetical protein
VQLNEVVVHPLQTVEVIDPRQRDRRLPELLKQYHGNKRQNRIIVFVL